MGGLLDSADHIENGRIDSGPIRGISLGYQPSAISSRGSRKLCACFHSLLRIFRCRDFSSKGVPDAQRGPGSR